MPGPLRPYTRFPDDMALGSSAKQCLDWIVSTVSNLQPQLFQPATPIVTTVSHPSAVLVAWNEVAGAISYAVFETSTQQAPPGVPLATVPANLGASSNSILRPNINDTVTRYYVVQAIGNNSRSATSAPTPGSALIAAAPVVPVSQAPLNQAGVGGGIGGGGAIEGITARLDL